MKIKFFIITYNNNKILNDWILKSLHESNYDRKNVEIFVIDNHSNVYINDEYKFVKVLENNLRPDFSTGHLSRNHNQAIINGFESLVNPKCDIVVSCQNDTKVLKDWYQTLCQAMKTYTYFCPGSGDQLQAWTTEGVRRIGLYDERFSNIGYHERDYFVRAMLYNKEYSSIAEAFLNVHHTPLLEATLNGGQRKEPSHLASMTHHRTSRAVLCKKWGDKVCAGQWHSKNLKCLIDNYFMYPYFEKDIYNAEEKGYIS